MSEAPHATLIVQIRPILAELFSTKSIECASWFEQNVAALVNAWSRKVGAVCACRRPPCHHSLPPPLCHPNALFQLSPQFVLA